MLRRSARTMRTRLYNCFALILLYVTSSNAFREGDFVQTARKAQFHQSRTQWHDLLGHHCPRFGRNRLVAVPLHKPVAALLPGDEYKIQLSFDGDRHMTPWLKLMGKGAPALPVLQVELRRAGEEVLGVNAKVIEAPISYQHNHAQLLAEFQNSTHWPKHLLVMYTFKTENDVDLIRGLYILFSVGLLACLVLIINAVRGVHPKLAQFLQEMTAEDISETTWKGAAKAE